MPTSRPARRSYPTTHCLPLLASGPRVTVPLTVARWAYYQKLSGTLSLFKVDKRTGAPDWGSLRGTAAAEHAVRRRALAGLPYVFAVFCHSDKMFELSVRDAADLERWLEVLPTFVAVGEAAKLDLANGRSHVMAKLAKANPPLPRPRPPPSSPSPSPSSSPSPSPYPWPSAAHLTALRPEPPFPSPAPVTLPSTPTPIP